MYGFQFPEGPREVESMEVQLPLLEPFQHAGGSVPVHLTVPSAVSLPQNIPQLLV